MFATWNLKISKEDLSLAWMTRTDFSSNYLQASGLIESGSRWIYPRIGPEGVRQLTSSHAASFDLLHEITLRFFALVTKNPFVTVNLAFLSTFAMTAISCVLLLRYLRVDAKIAFVVSLAFALVPYHFIRAQHFLVANYSWAPVLVLGVLLINRDQKYQENLNRRGIALCFLFVASSGGYYLLYSVITLGIFGFILASISRESIKIVRSLYGIVGVFLAFVIGYVVYVLQVPSSNNAPASVPRGGNEAFLNSARIYDFMFPSETTNSFKIFFSWIREQIVTSPNPYLCESGVTSPYALKYSCHLAIEGSMFGSLISTIGILLLLLLIVGGASLKVGTSARLILSIFLVYSLYSVTNGFGAIVEVALNSSRKPGTAIPIIITCSFVIFALTANFLAKKLTSKLSKHLLLLVIFSMFVFDHGVSRYDFIIESRVEQRALRDYSRNLANQIDDDCIVFRAPSGYPSQKLDRRIQSEYLSMAYAGKQEWILADTRTFTISEIDFRDNLVRSAVSAKFNGYCVFEMVRPYWISENFYNFENALKFLKEDLQLKEISRSTDGNAFSFDLRSLKDTQTSFSNLLNAPHLLEKLSSNITYTWISRYQNIEIFTNVIGCHLVSFDLPSPTEIRHFLLYPTGAMRHQGIEFESGYGKKYFMNLNSGDNQFSLWSREVPELLPDSREVTGYLSIPKINKVDDSFCKSNASKTN
jgi:hypothetical protein